MSHHARCPAPGRFPYGPTGRGWPWRDDGAEVHAGPLDADADFEKVPAAWRQKVRDLDTRARDAPGPADKASCPAAQAQAVNATARAEDAALPDAALACWAG
jgi:hypothetical protein